MKRAQEISQELDRLEAKSKALRLEQARKAQTDTKRQKEQLGSLLLTALEKDGKVDSKWLRLWVARELHSVLQRKSDDAQKAGLLGESSDQAAAQTLQPAPEGTGADQAKPTTPSLFQRPHKATE